ncbi:acyltransferase family protein [Nonomuraea maheshkhaliensis]|uniref:Acyltransferase family protein n=1 Tax=Nonomuraea maheshkhaliensis TaxID=419590 RepID=A0ABN2EVK6_9ACTN
MSETRSSRPVTPPRSPEEGPADTGARWPLPEETFWSEATDPHGVAPGERTAPQAAVPPVQAKAPTQAPTQAPAQVQAAESGAKRQERPEPRPQPEQPKPRKRDPFLDNVKFILIALVPIGHSLVPTLAADSARALYIFIYVFHMPLFVVISGYLSRNFWNSNAKTNKLVDTFLVPYVIVEVGYAALRFSLGQKWSLTIIDPAWLNWYLLALLFWRLSTPVWKRMKYPVPVAIAIYLFAGFSQISGDFSMDRFFGLLPFFVIGLVLQPEHFELLNRRWIKIVSVVTVLCAAAVAILIAPMAKLGPFYYKNSYQDLDLSWYMGIGLRLGLLVCALAMCFAVLALVPRRETWYTDLGTRTLYCYLLHGIPVLIAKEMGWLEFPWLHGPLGVLAISTSCFALAIILCLPETRTVFKWVLEPRLVWLYRRPSRS